MKPMPTVLSNQSPAPTAPIAPTAPVPPIDPLEPPTRVPPFQPIERTAPIWPVAPVAPVHLAQPVASVQLAQPMQPLPPVQRPPGLSVAERAAMITYLVVGVVEALIIIRVILKLLAANPSSGFVRFIYNVSAPLVAPFQGIFPTPVTQNSVLELSAFVAIAAYALIAWVIVRLIAIVGQRQSSS
jgi:YggT family protein